jgi:hypothetical protein
MLESAAKPDTKWFVFIPERSGVNLKHLTPILSRYPSDYGIFLAHRKPETIYPNFATGFILSRQIVRDLYFDMNEGRYGKVIFFSFS